MAIRQHRAGAQKRCSQWHIESSRGDGVGGDRARRVLSGQGSLPTLIERSQKRCLLERPAADAPTDGLRNVGCAERVGYPLKAMQALNASLGYENRSRVLTVQGPLSGGDRLN